MTLQFSTLSMPTLPGLVLSEDERRIVERLAGKQANREAAMRLSEAYYLGEQVIDNLRIAVPEELEFLRTIVGWPALAVDPYVERLEIDGFRLPDATDTDATLGDLAVEVGLEASLPLAVTDALSIGRAYWLIGSPAEKGDVPTVTVESPMNIAVEWDLRGLTPRAAWQAYWSAGRRHGALVLPRRTIHLAVDDGGVWQVVDRDEHDFDFLPLVRMPHMARTNARGGRSAITPAIRSTTDSACRDLLDLEVAREIYSVPGITLLGAAEADFQNTDGTAKSAWQAYITRLRALERDENGELPSIHQAQVYDPAVLLKPLEFRASQMSSMVAAPPQDLGLYTSGNPVSFESADAQEKRRNRRARRMQKQFGPDAVEVMKMVLRFLNKGTLPDEFRRMTTDWADVDEVSMGIASDAITKQISSGAIPATSDVTLKKLGWSAVERRRLAQDRSTDDSRNAKLALLNTLTPRQEPASGDAPTA